MKEMMGIGLRWKVGGAIDRLDELGEMEGVDFLINEHQHNYNLKSNCNAYIQIPSMSNRLHQPRRGHQQPLT